MTMTVAESLKQENPQDIITEAKFVCPASRTCGCQSRLGALSAC